MAPATTRDQERQKEAENEKQAGQSDNAMLAQMMEMKEMMKNMSMRMDAIEARSRPTTPTPAPTIPAPQAPQALPTQPATSDDKRWRPEEVGYFDGSGDVYAFTDRLSSIATNKGVRLVQTSLVTVLKDTAFNWYQYELTDVTKWALNTNALIDPWCQALIERFGPNHSELMSQLEACQYTRKDAANKKDATTYIQDIMKITKGLKWNQQDGLMTAFHHFEPGLQRDLDPPNEGLTQFIKQVQLRQAAWHQVYSTFGQKPRPPEPPTRPYPPRPQQSYPPRPPQQPFRSQQPHPSQQTRLQQAYWGEAEEEDDWIYDAPADSYHVTSAYPVTHGPGHTPRRYGNTYDDGSNEARVHWTNAGEDHRCSHQGCTHYH